MRTNKQRTWIMIGTVVVLALIWSLAGGVLGSERTLEPVVASARIQQTHPEVNMNSEGPYGIGRAATEEEIAAWDTDARPDGTGLPPGGGTVAEGATIYAEKCVACHGEDGTGGPYAGGRLGAGMVGSYDADAPWPQFPLTIGGFWPYATTVYDYTYRAMPYDNPGSLEPDEVYALVAWILHESDLIPADAVMNAESLPQVEMPALKHFLPYDVRDTYPHQ